VNGREPLRQWNYRVDFVLSRAAREAEVSAQTALHETHDAHDAAEWGGLSHYSAATLVSNACCAAVQYLRPSGKIVTRHLTYTFTERSDFNFTSVHGGSRPPRRVTVSREGIQDALFHLIVRDNQSQVELESLYKQLVGTPEHLRRHEVWMDAATMAAKLAEVAAVRHVDLGG
jgi:hypothetical protein